MHAATLNIGHGKTIGYSDHGDIEGYIFYLCMWHLTLSITLEVKNH